MMDEAQLEERFGDVGDEALANHVRDLVSELNIHLREARRRNVGVSISTLRGDDGHGYQVERIWAERKL